MNSKFGISLSGFELIKKKDSSYLKGKINEVIAILGLENQLITVHLCDDAEIKSLNQKFRRKNKATDVLSFNASCTAEDPFFGQVLGDIVISVETARTQADSAGHEFVNELCVLFVHGLLHLLGYDHELGEEEAVKQAEAELFLLSGIDVPVETALMGRQL